MRSKFFLELPKFSASLSLGKVALAGKRLQEIILRINRKVLLGILGIVVIGGSLIVGRIYMSNVAKNAALAKVTVKAARATTLLNKEFQLPIRDDAGKELTRIKFNLITADLRDEILVRGQKATPLAGKTFLILTIKIVNDYNKAISINARDFIRLSIDGNDQEWLAAEVHSDPVDVRAASTKETRIGYTVKENYKSLTLKVGEITGDRQTVDLKF